MPTSVHILAIGIFAMVTSELVVGGLMPQMSEDLGVSISSVGYLITAFALAMALGGPLLALAVFRLSTRRALLTLFAVFLVGNALAAAAASYELMAFARIVTGAASGAFFGVAVSAAAQVTAPELRGRATSVVLQGLMLGTALGLPLSTLIGGRFGWRAVFVAIGVLTLVAAVATALALPTPARTVRADQTARTEEGQRVELAAELQVFRRPGLWCVMATSTLVIGATFAAFSYFAPILTEVTGFSRGSVPLLLLGYGAATVVGNLVVGRLAQSHTFPVLLGGLALNAVFLTAFALLADHRVAALLAVLGIGLVGITLNPAMITRVQRAGNTGMLVNTAHSSFITLGVVLGSWLGGLGISAFDLRAPLWVGGALAVLALAATVPAALRHRNPPTSVTQPDPAAS